MAFADGFFKLASVNNPILDKDVASMFGLEPQTDFDVGQSAQIVIYPQVDIQNDVTTNQKAVFEIDGRQRPNTIIDTNTFILTGNIKVTDEDGKEVTDTDIDAAPINNALLSLFSTCTMYIEGEEVASIQDFPLVNQINDMFGSTSETRKTYFPDGGVIFDQAGKMETFHAFPTTPSGSTVPEQPNKGYKSRQAWYCNAKKGDTAATHVFKWNKPAKYFAKRLVLPLGRKIPQGLTIRLILNYDGNWSNYFLSSNPKAKKLKPHLSNLALRVETYNVNSIHGAQLKQKFDAEGAHYQYNDLYVDKTFLQKGSTIFRTNMLNRNRPFSRMFVVLLPTAAYMGALDKNPYDFKIQGFKGVGDTTVYLEDIQAIQNQINLNDFYHSGNRGTAVVGFEPDYLRTVRLANSFAQPIPQFSWSRAEFEHGYAVHTFSCTALQSEIGSPTARVIAGPVSLQAKFSGVLDEEVTIVAVCENQEEIEFKPEGNNIVSVQTKRIRPEAN